jgi:formylglycine-generating enzyme required for sulfatase activity
MKQAQWTINLVMLISVLTTGVQADVFNMGGIRNADGTWNGLASLETVPVDNAGNVADTRYSTSGYGSVSYEYRMGKYEIMAGQYTAFLNAVAKTDTYGLYGLDMDMARIPTGCNIKRSGSSGNYTYSVTSDYANRPVNCVSWAGAARFCNWLTNGQPTGDQNSMTTEDGSYSLNGATANEEIRTITRKANARYVIPSENEWYKAAYHKNDGVTGNYWDYPTGTNSIPSNFLTHPDSGNNANFSLNKWTSGMTIGYPYLRTFAGDFENSESPYGTFDQGGNVLEWHEETLYGTDQRGLRGGYFYSNVNDLLASYRGSYDWGHGMLTPTTNGDFIGFRIAEVPEPATLSLFALGSLAYLRQRKS